MEQEQVICPNDIVLFYLNKAQLNKNLQGEAQMYGATASFTLLIAIQGQAQVFSEECSWHLLSGTALLLPPWHSFKIQNETEQDLTYYCLEFSGVGMPHDHDSQDITLDWDEKVFVNLGQTITFPLARVHKYITNILELGKSTIDKLASYKIQSQFQEVMLLLMEHWHQEGIQSGDSKSVGETMDYMQTYYSHKITVRQLADLANMPQYQYTALFQQLTGKKPLNYLNSIRIERAKEWLRNSDYTLREIAEYVGFGDEYYFSRRFRQSTGQTPRQYVEFASNTTIQVRDWIGREVSIPIHAQRIVFYGETYGDLQELGVSTVAGSNLWQLDDVTQLCFKPLEGGGFDINVEQLASLHPDLIILGSSDRLQINKAATVAPTVAFNTFAPLEQRLLKLGDLLGRRTIADQWLKSYRAQREAMWKRVHEVVPSEETVAVFIVDRQRLFVMGTVGLTVTLYHESGFQPPPSVADLLRQGISFIEITVEQIAEYAGDRIFMVLTEDPLSQELVHKIVDHDKWTSLSAISQGKLHVVEEMEWNFGDAHTSVLLLDKLPKLLL
jgi:ABC-type Fe3+-hydroxamate transport system substrate-binding protein